MVWNEIQSDVSEIESSGGSFGVHLGNLAQMHEVLFEEEMKSNAEQLIGGILFFTVTFAVAVGSVLLLGLAAAEAIIETYPGLPRSASILTVGAAMCLLAVIGATSGFYLFRKFSFVPRQSVQSLRETAKCLMQQS